MKKLTRSPRLALVVFVLVAGAAAVALTVLAEDPSRSESLDSAQSISDSVAAPAIPASSGLAAADLNGDGIVYQDGMHPQIVRDEPGRCPICGMDLMPVRVDGHDEGAVEIDPVTIQNIGVRTAPVKIEALGRTVRATGRFETNEQGRSAVSPKIAGWVEQLHVEYEGARVRRGQPLLTIYSPELVSTQEEYLLALRNAERLGGTADAQRLVEATRRRLANWDISEAQIEHLEASGQAEKTLTLFAPASGTVTMKDVVEGEQIVPGKTLMELSDLSRVWLMVDVYEQDLAWVGVGTNAHVALPYDAGRTITGTVDYVYDTLDPATRTVKARVTLDNPGLLFKPGMYATVTLQGGVMPALPVIPEEALIRTGTGAIVVLAMGDGRFRPVEVVSGSSSGGLVQILSGLVGGERVVTSAQFLIDSESRLKSAVDAMGGGHSHGSGPPEDDEPDTLPATSRALGGAVDPARHLRQ